jgi:hypothetical protein
VTGAALLGVRTVGGILCNSVRFRRFTRPLAKLSALLVMAAFVGIWLDAAAVIWRMSIEGARPLAAETRDPDQLRDVEALNDHDIAELAAWVDRTGRSPADYAVEKARQHQLVLFGERHLMQQELDLLHELIPRLYEEAQVTVVAMEFFQPHENRAMLEVVTAPTFDRDAALDIARRSDVWAYWGYEGYWRVLETVWRVNQNAPDGREPMRIIGIGSSFDGASMALAGMIPWSPSGPPWERLRLARYLALGFPEQLSHEARMARELETEVFDTHERAIAWVGANHALLRIAAVGQVRAPAGTGRLGFLIAQRHPSDVFAVHLHREFRRTGDTPGGLTSTLERVMREQDSPVGFDVDASPFANLRDGHSLLFRDPRISMSDLASGYVFLGPVDQLTGCSWTPGYITESMFVAHRPFYEAWGEKYGVDVRSAAEADALFAGLDEPP